MEYLYNVAGLNIKCTIPFPIVIQEESVEFMTVFCEKNNMQVDFEIRFKETACLPIPSGNRHTEGTAVYSENEENSYITFSSAPGKDPYACVVWEKGLNNQMTCWYLKGEESYLEYSRNIMNHAGLENILSVFRGVLLHSSFIKWRNKGVLFCGPSGVGKSTQANLWKKHENAEILNGDRAGIRCVEDMWYAYGLPYAGSSGIYRNDKAELCAIVVLHQASENTIERLDAATAFRYLYPEVTVHRWERSFVERTWGTLVDLLAAVPVYKLNCNVDKNAVEVLKRIIDV